MTDYIKREDLLELYDLGGLEVENAKVPLNVVIQTIKDMSSADVVERKRGKWEMKPDPYGFFDEIPVCSECGCTTKMREKYNFCPNCGARMEREEEK